MGNQNIQQVIRRVFMSSRSHHSLVWQNITIIAQFQSYSRNTVSIPGHGGAQFLLTSTHDDHMVQFSTNGATVIQVNTAGHRNHSDSRKTIVITLINHGHVTATVHYYWGNDQGQHRSRESIIVTGLQTHIQYQEPRKILHYCRKCVRSKNAL